MNHGKLISQKQRGWLLAGAWVIGTIPWVVAPFGPFSVGYLMPFGVVFLIPSDWFSWLPFRSGLWTYASILLGWALCIGLTATCATQGVRARFFSWWGALFAWLLLNYLGWRVGPHYHF